MATEIRPGVTLITPTGARPEALRHCARYVARFSCSFGISVQWLIIDDGPEVSEFEMPPCSLSVTVDHVRPRHRWNGNNTQALNILTAIDEARHDFIMFIEDDDFYAPSYLRLQYLQLQTSSISGIIPARYYHVPSGRHSVLNNTQHASLCQTAIRSCHLKLLRSICEGGTKFIDIELWGRINPASAWLVKAPELCVGLKGLPGRPGIGLGHIPEYIQDWSRDDDSRTVLRNWIGQDAEAYVKTIKTSPAPQYSTF